MNSKDKILENIRISTLKRQVDLEDILSSQNLTVEENSLILLDKFKNSLAGVSAEYRFFSDFSEAKDIINNFFSGYKQCVNMIKDIAISGIKLDELSSPKALHPLDLAIIKGEFGVAENGAIWVDAGKLPDRAIPFLCENLVVMIDSNELVTDMHQAYQRTDTSDYSYGVFITGPSKTADIEQTLVVGAQGPKRMLVLCKGYD